MIGDFLSSKKNQIKKLLKISLIFIVYFVGYQVLAWLPIGVLKGGGAWGTKILDWPICFETNANVQDPYTTADHVFIVGIFRSAGRCLGNTGAVNATTGAAPVAYANWPKITGTVTQAVDDGAGGWVIAGTFTSVGGVARSNLARINSNGSLHAFAPTVTPYSQGYIYGLTRSGSTLYVSGDFSQINGTARNCMATLNIDTGALLSFNPNLGAGCQVYQSSSIIGSNIHVLGNFQSVAGTVWPGYAAINTTGGTVDTNVKALFSGSQTGNIETNGTDLYTSAKPGVRNYMGIIDLSTGRMDYTTAQLNGSVTKIISDGSGGWFVAGSFTTIDGSPRSGIARINANGTLHAFSATVNSTVYAMALVGTSLYIGGSFTTVNGTSRDYMAGVDSTTGALNSVDPKANSWVMDLHNDGNHLYVGGYFTNIFTKPRNYLGRATLAGGGDISWLPNPNGAVFSISSDATNIYVGGSFTSLGASGGAPRTNLGSVDKTTAVATSWAPDPNSSVNDLKMSGSTLFVAGQFSSIAGQSTYFRVVSFDTTTGSLNTWNTGGPAYGYSVDTDGANVYYSTWYNLQSIPNTGGVAQTYADPGFYGGLNTAKISSGKILVGASNPYLFGPTLTTPVVYKYSATTGSIDESFSVTAFGNQINALALSGSNLYVAGIYTSLNGMNRFSLAKVSATTGSVQSFNPSLKTPWGSSTGDAYVYNLLASGTTIYVSGSFTEANGSFRSHIAAFDTGTDALNSGFAPIIGNYGMIVKSGANLLLGTPIFVDGVQRDRFAVLEKSTGNLLQSKFDFNGSVYAIQVLGNHAYVGGVFSTVNGVARNNLVRITSDGTVEPWNPNPNGIIYKLIANQDTLFTIGSYTTIGGAARNYLSGVDLTTGTATAFNPSPNGYVKPNLLIANNRLFVSGTFNSMSGVGRIGIASFSIPSMTLDSWNPNPNSYVYAMDLSGTTMYMAGLFGNINGTTRGKIGAVDVNSGAVLGWYPGAATLQLNGLKYDNGWVWTGNTWDIAGNARNAIYKINAASGALDAMDIPANGSTFSMKLKIEGINGYYFGNSLVTDQPRNFIWFDTAAGTLH